MKAKQNPKIDTTGEKNYLRDDAGALAQCGLLKLAEFPDQVVTRDVIIAMSNISSITIVETKYPDKDGPPAFAVCYWHQKELAASDVFKNYTLALERLDDVLKLWSLCRRSF